MPERGEDRQGIVDVPLVRVSFLQRISRVRRRRTIDGDAGHASFGECYSRRLVASRGVVVRGDERVDNTVELRARAASRTPPEREVVQRVRRVPPGAAWVCVAHTHTFVSSNGDASTDTRSSWTSASNDPARFFGVVRGRFAGRLGDGARGEYGGNLAEGGRLEVGEDHAGVDDDDGDGGVRAETRAGAGGRGGEDERARPLTLPQAVRGLGDGGVAHHPDAVDGARAVARAATDHVRVTVVRRDDRQGPRTRSATRPATRRERTPGRMRRERRRETTWRDAETARREG